MKLFLALCAALISNSAYANKTAYNIEESKKRCQTHYTDSQTLYSDNFSFGMSLQSMAEKFEEIYASNKRLDLHSYYNKENDSFYLYVEQEGKIAPVKVTENFIKSVTRQIEVALEKGYAEYVFFPDMGHSHLYFKQDHWDNTHGKLNYPLGIIAPLYEKMLADPEAYPLYHLAEQLKMMDDEKNLLEDPHLQFRYWNRNYVGKNDGSDYSKIYVSKEYFFNSVSSIEGHKLYSAGFAVSASHKGCFAYIDKDGNKKYFDIGLQDPKSNPNNPYVDIGI